jgi:nucleoside-diphosphate-sugar epimerase
MDLATKWGIVTGGAGFVGQHVVRLLRRHGRPKIVVPRRAQYDLTHEAAVERPYDDARPEAVIHPAAAGSGLEANRANPGRFVYENLVMDALLMAYAWHSEATSILTTPYGTPCKSHDTSPTTEHSLA